MFQDILKDAIENNLTSPTDMPYFEGDFWPNVLEESIKELDQEEEEKRKQAEAEAAAAEVTVPVEGPQGPESVSLTSKTVRSNLSQSISHFRICTLSTTVMCGLGVVSHRVQNTCRHAALCRAATVICREALQMFGRCTARLAAMLTVKMTQNRSK